MYSLVEVEDFRKIGILAVVSSRLTKQLQNKLCCCGRDCWFNLRAGSYQGLCRWWWRQVVSKFSCGGKSTIVEKAASLVCGDERVEKQILEEEDGRLTHVSMRVGNQEKKRYVEKHYKETIATKTS